MRVADPPVIGSVYRSPRRSNTSVRPSGDTSTDIQVPSSVVNLRGRVGTSGSPPPPPPAPPPPAPRCAATGGADIASATQTRMHRELTIGSPGEDGVRVTNHRFLA